MHYALADHLAQAVRELVQVVLAVEPSEPCTDEDTSTVDGATGVAPR